MASGISGLLPNAQSFSEWSVILNGAIATCVEASELVLLHMQRLVPLSPQLDISLTRDLQARGQAGSGGATNWSAASSQLTRLGLPNTALGPSYFATHDLPSILSQASVDRPVLVGVGNAQALRDSWTGQYYNRGVLGHALTVVGHNSQGFITADPNTPQAQSGGFVLYTANNLRQAAADSLVIPNAASGPGPVSSGTSLVSLNTGVSFPATGLDPSTLAQAISSGVSSGVSRGVSGGISSGLSQAASQQAAPLSRWTTHAGQVVGLVILGGLLILVGLVIFFLSGNVAGASPAEHTRRGVRTAASVAAVAG